MFDSIIPLLSDPAAWAALVTLIVMEVVPGIDMVLIAEGFGAHVPKGYIYAAMAFSAGVGALNMAPRKAAVRKQAALDARQVSLNKAETAEPGV